MFSIGARWACVVLTVSGGFVGATTAVEPVESTDRAPYPGSDYTVPRLGVALIWVKPGAFVMGSGPDEPDRNRAEGPQTRVTLTQGFWLGKTEITQGQYERLMGVNPSTFSAAGPTTPVERVSWDDAMAFCGRLNAQEAVAGRLPEGYRYSLPTEAQWEYACRAGTTGMYPGDPDAIAWHAGNSDGRTHPAGEKRPNAWGFHDLTGNVVEWCLDWYGNYPGGEVADPSGPSRGHYRIARGGSWRTPATLGRSAARSGGSQGRLDYTIGFRVALVSVTEPAR